MLSLKAAQAKLIATINTGPDVLDPSLFDGPVDRILLGLKAHANTISHARLTALEASFPMTRNALGEAAFNTLSRQYVESSLIGSLDNNHIGCRFSAFLNSADVSVCEYELAQIEWAYLNSYNAPEAQPLCLADLAPLSEVALLAQAIMMHPSAQIIALSTPISDSLDGLAGLSPPALLLVRPDSEVLLHALDARQWLLLNAACNKNATLGNLLALCVEQGGELSPLEAIIQLINAGALIATG
jgi:Putative DNA-binding domain